MKFLNALNKRKEIWSLIASAIFFIAGILTQIILTQKLDNAGYAEFSIAMGGINIALYTIALTSVILFSNNKNDTSQVISIGFIISIIEVIFILIISNIKILNLWLVLINVSLNYVIITINSIFISKREYKKQFMLTIINSTIKIICALILPGLLGNTGAILIYVITPSITLIFLMFYLKNNSKRADFGAKPRKAGLRPTFNLNLKQNLPWKNLNLQLNWTLIINYLLIITLIFITQSDIFFVKLTNNPNLAGLYNKIMLFPRLILSIGIPIFNILIPQNMSNKKKRKIFIYGFAIFTLMSTLLFIVLDQIHSFQYLLPFKIITEYNPTQIILGLMLNLSYVILIFSIGFWSKTILKDLASCKAIIILEIISLKTGYAIFHISINYGLIYLILLTLTTSLVFILKGKNRYITLKILAIVTLITYLIITISNLGTITIWPDTFFYNKLADNLKFPIQHASLFLKLSYQSRILYILLIKTLKLIIKNSLAVFTILNFIAVFILSSYLIIKADKKYLWLTTLILSSPLIIELSRILTPAIIATTLVTILIIKQLHNQNTNFIKILLLTIRPEISLIYSLPINITLIILFIIGVFTGEVEFSIKILITFLLVNGLKFIYQKSKNQKKIKYLLTLFILAIIITWAIISYSALILNIILLIFYSGLTILLLLISIRNINILKEKEFFYKTILLSWLLLVLTSPNNVKYLLIILVIMLIIEYITIVNVSKLLPNSLYILLLITFSLCIVSYNKPLISWKQHFIIQENSRKIYQICNKKQNYKLLTVYKISVDFYYPNSCQKQILDILYSNNSENLLCKIPERNDSKYFLILDDYTSSLCSNVNENLRIINLEQKQDE